MTVSRILAKRLFRCTLALTTAATLAACGGDGVSDWRKRVFTPPAPITA